MKNMEAVVSSMQKGNHEVNDLIGNSKDIDSVTRSATDRINLYLSETGE